MKPLEENTNLNVGSIYFDKQHFHEHWYNEVSFLLDLEMIKNHKQIFSSDISPTVDFFFFV